MTVYGVCIGSYISENNFMFCEAQNKAEARKAGNLYRRKWEISDPIQAIVEIPEGIENVGERREYAVRGASA